VTDKITKMFPRNAAKDPDTVLEMAKDKYKKVCVLGVNKDDHLEFRASLNMNRSELLWVMEHCKMVLLQVSVDEEDD